jgi:predicted peptidase
MASLEKTVAEYSIDDSRVYLTGLVMGGNGCWYLA